MARLAKATDDIELVPGMQVGRYLVARPVAAGAMGVVYEAFDPSLQRRVALKVLRPDLLSRRKSVRERLLREAQALAQVEHPNVVRVFDVGPVHDSLFVAMEFVAGCSGHEWLGRAPSWPEVLDCFTAAARGLAAIHAAGLVHRDFKPSNIVVGADARVRVLDLGLARAAGAPSEATTAAMHRGGAGDTHEALGRLQEPITKTGAAVGTPPYMAPEQHTGEPSDARADQFAFCVSLYEALVGRRPFEGRSAHELSAAKHRGEIAPPPAGDVPRAVFSVLARGLRPQPHRRWPSMLALVAALDRARRPVAQRRGARVAIVAATAALGSIAGYAALREAPTCDLSNSGLPSVVPRDRIERLRGRFERSGADPGGVAWASAAARIDGFSNRWTNAWTLSCQARTLGEPAASTDLRSTCLADRLAELDTRLALLETGAPQTIRNAVFALGGLQPPGLCMRGAVTGTAPPPSLKPAVDDLRRTIDQSRALQDAGAYDDALRKAEQAMTVAGALGYAPTRAEALHRYGRSLDASGRGAEAVAPLREAAILATAEGHDRTAARAAIDLGGLRQHISEEAAARWLRRAEASLVRQGEPADLRAAWLNNRALLDIAEDRPADGFAKLESALSITEQLHGPRHPAVARALDNLSIAAHRLGRLPQARALSREALAVLTASLGDTHPHVGNALINAGGLANAAFDFEAAVDLYERALVIHATPHNADQQAQAYALDGLGFALSGLGRHTEALEHQRRALLLLSGNDDDPRRGNSHLSIGRSLSGLARYEAALHHFERARDIFSAALGDEHSATAAARNNIGTALQLLGRWEEAKVAYRAALLTLRATATPAPSEVAKTLGNLAFVARRGGDVGDAREALREGIALLDSPDHADPHVQGRLGAALGSLELEAGNRDVARAALERAIPQLRSAGAPEQDLRDAEADLRRASDGA